MINLEDIITAASIIWIKKYLDNTERDWKHTLEWLSKRKNLRVFLMSNYDVNELPSYMSKYYLTPFQKWSKLSSKTDSIKEQCLWYNKGIKVGKKSVFCSNLFSIGMWFV